MALYRTGTAAMDAQGVITGTGTKWREPLSLIRTGATIVFLTSPLKLAVISDIVSDTEMKAIQTDGEPVENGNYVILLNDSLTVDGMAQDVSETLRYYQSKETVIEEAIEFFKNFDLKTLQDLVSRAEASAQKTDADRAATEQLKNDTQTIKDAAVSETQQIKDSAVSETQQIKADTDAIKNQTQQIKDSAVTEITGIKNEALNARDEAENAQFAAEQSKVGADNAKAGAETARDEARQWAQQVQPENLLHKDQNLADLPDKAASRKNLALDRVSQFPSETLLRSPYNATYFTVGVASWGVYDSINATWKPLAVAQGGTGAKTAAEARKNIGGQWEETQKFLNSEAIAIVRPSASVDQWIAFYREDNTSAIRLGHEANGSLAAHSYNEDGSYREKILQIDADATVNIFAALYSNAGINGTFALLKQNSYPRVELISSGRSGSTDVGARLSIEIPSGDGSHPYFVRRNLYNDNNQIVNNLPSTSGALAIQGTSGREYKKDISLADSNEALSRVTSLEMVNFVYKDDEKQRVRFGIIAEDAEKIAPQYVKHNQFPVPGTEVFDDEGNKISEEYQDRPSIDVNPIVMDLLGCVQAQQKQIDELKATISEMQAMFVQIAK